MRKGDAELARDVIRDLWLHVESYSEDLVIKIQNAIRALDIEIEHRCISCSLPMVDRTPNDLDGIRYVCPNCKASVDIRERRCGCCSVDEYPGVAYAYVTLRVED